VGEYGHAGEEANVGDQREETMEITETTEMSDMRVRLTSRWVR
jgi:hypothetical protein